MEEPNINYDLIFNNFSQKIKDMRVGSIKRSGIKKIAKPVLLLALIKGIEDGVFKHNSFEYEKLASIYEAVFKKYADISKQTEYTPLYYPFFHLHTSDFWNLCLKTPHSDRFPSTISVGWIRNNVEYAYIDPKLWDMLQHKVYRNRLAEFIVDEKIKAATARSHTFLRLFLNWLVAI